MVSDRKMIYKWEIFHIYVFFFQLHLFKFLRPLIPHQWIFSVDLTVG